MCIIALEYAIAGCCDGGAYLVHADSIADIAEAIEECAGITQCYPPGVTEEEWDEYGQKWHDEFDAEVQECATLLWHFANADVSIPLPWRDGFVVRAWRVSPDEAKEWEDA